MNTATATAPAAAPPKMRTPIESGVPDNKPYLHPLMLKNYGNWKWHDRPRPGVLHHVAHSGDEIWTVRAGTQRQMDVYTIRKLCDIADTYADGHVRFTIRSNIEFMVADPNKVAPLIESLTSNGFPVGGTGNSVSMIAHTQGWLHCDIPGTDASGAVKALMDDLHKEFIREEMPNRVHMSTSCCEINCGGQADIAIIILGKHEFERCMQDNFQVVKKLMQILVRRLREADRNIESLALLDVYGRVARLLLDMSEDDSGKRVVRQKISKQDMARMIGASREMVSKVMRDLEVGGYIISEGDHITITGT